MRGLFNYESRFIQSIMMLADILILNVLYLLFSLPLFTIGAAQAGLYTGFRVLLDADDDSSCAAAFLRGFKNGFTVITPVWLLLTAVAALIGAIYFTVPAYALRIVLLSGFCIVIVIQTLSPIYHSWFSCTRRQLMQNAFYLLAAYPLRALGSVLLIWAPVLLFFINAHVFMELANLLLFFWYAVAGIFSVLLMKKPYTLSKAHFLRTHNEIENPIEPQENTDK
ncbi:MAG: DUF624 domain-containing protein [Ruminococcaceae bacterium]|nr:DUF624 domain-containing protein [Oscillospiraceae bacterium]